MATAIPVRSTAASKASPDLAASPSQSLLSSSAPSTALYNFRLLAALRSDSPSQVQPYLDELKAGGQNAEADPGKLLGMAVRVASTPILTQILASPNISSPNLPISPNSTATALHVASEIGRAEAVELLLNDPRTDDTIRDDQGRTPLELAASADVAGLIEDSRAALQVRYMSLLANYVGSSLSSAEESSRINAFLNGPRCESLNLSALDERTGTSLLHEAARRRDLRLVELAVKRGADVFVRDRRGKRVLEGDKGADERIKAYIRQFSNQETLVQPKSDGRPPDLKGFLSKWVNYRQGWKTRWFVLENGVLSYYRNREDETVACRGSIALATANVHLSSDGQRFEVSSAVTTSVPKIIVKSNVRAEIARWVQVIRLNLEYYNKSGKGRTGRTPMRSTSVNTTATDRLGSTLNDLPPSDGFLNPRLKRTATGLSGISVHIAQPVPSEGSRKRDSSPGDSATLDEALDASSFIDADQESVASGGGVLDTGIPHESTFELGVLHIKAQLETTAQLVDSFVTPPSSTQGSPSRAVPKAEYSRQQQVKDAIRESIESLSISISQQNVRTQDRERYLLGRIQREVEARRLWEENLLTVAHQQAETDRQLSEAAKDNEKKRRALRQARGVLAGLSVGSISHPVSPMGESVTMAPAQTSPGIPDASPPVSDATPSLPISPMAFRGSISIPPSGLLPRASISNIQEVHDVVAAAAEDDSEEEDDDEFFDAIETGTIPNLQLHDSIAHPERPGTPVAFAEGQAVPQKSPAGTISRFLARQSLEPYNHVRNKLPIDDDKRPSVSLWSILKSSIGKDLTKISFPVSFNECTSMLQRMAEDMEYDACLTVAATEQDSLKRIAFVAAFAMSNYSSTIGRIAKPFNPLLSQSYEYAIPNRYRYISEQVSHHPPISACYCEAPTWKYYGEVDAQNKFQGRSFEIRPTGVAHAELVIPKSWVNEKLEYPAAGSEYPEGNVIEHYSWKKVTTNVSNFIMGSPIIDHYGDLTVTNHRTGETCTLTFKPRGWRGKDAFEIKGHVYNSERQTVWDIAGRWDSQLIARQAGSSAPLDVDTQIQDTKEYLLLWRNSEKPKAPFNLTPFALTLNDIPSGLENYLCPTDCRLRTDQRAFENAEYDRAQMLKTSNEEKQRETRKLRAEGRLPPHEPRWFTSTVDADDGERLWIPKRADNGEVKFWAEREVQGRAPSTQKWTEIDHIFVED